MRRIFRSNIQPTVETCWGLQHTSMVSRAGAKQIPRKPKLKIEPSSSATGPTSASDGFARQVTRSEFQELVSAVSLLRKECHRHISIEAQVGSELEVFGAQVASNKSALGKLAELLLDKTQQIHDTTAKQMQKLQVESDRRLGDLQLALERLEFRFKHHTRDCLSVAEQVDLHREAIQHCKSQLGQTQLALDKQVEQQQAFMEKMRYCMSTSEAHAKAIADECSSSLDAFKQRMLLFANGIEETTQQSLSVVVAQTRDLEVQGKRYKSLLHQHLDEQVNMQQALVELQAKLANHDLNEEDSRRMQRESLCRVELLEDRLGKLVNLMERRVERCDLEELIERSERNLKTRIDAVLEDESRREQLIQMCIHSFPMSVHNSHLRQRNCR